MDTLDYMDTLGGASMLKFDEKYMYGVREMDTEHKELIQKAEELMDAYQNNNPESEILKLLTFLKEYVEIHFKNEEALQVKFHYPAFPEHKQIHDDFKIKVTELFQEVQANGLQVQTRFTFNYLCSEWIVNHIGEEDRKLAEYILAHPIS